MNFGVESSSNCLALVLLFSSLVTGPNFMTTSFAGF